MNLNSILKLSSRPEIYTPGTHVMWIDKYISKQLLQIHLDSNIDLASRKETTIIKTVNWILSQTDGRILNILDLGCGPGLYAERLADRGHAVTGIDFSKESISYARSRAEKAGSEIVYRNENYLEMELPEDEYDLVIMIFTDFGVLSQEERFVLLKKIRKSLKSGGMFIFDVLNDKNWKEKASQRSWECSKGGFWSPEAYLALSESFIYEDEKVILNNHIIAGEESALKLYRFWIHFFSHDDLSGILAKIGFRVISFNNDVLPECDQWSGSNVTFTVAE